MDICVVALSEYGAPPLGERAMRCSQRGCGAEERHPRAVLSGPEKRSVPTPAPRPVGGFARMSAAEFRKTAPLRDSGENLLRPMAKPPVKNWSILSETDEKPVLPEKKPSEIPQKPPKPVDNPVETVETACLRGFFRLPPRYLFLISAIFLSTSTIFFSITCISFSYLSISLILLLIVD